MTVTTKILDEKGFTIQNKAAENDDTNEFHFEFPCLPRHGDLVKIDDGDARGEYVVVYPIIYEIVDNKSCPIMILKWQTLPKGVGGIIDN